MTMFDVVIVGGGPSGLSAALALGRCRRKVVVCDKGEPRNAASKALHGFLTRDGTDPQEFLRLGREELRRYPNVEFVHCEIVTAERGDREFTVRTDGGAAFKGRILLLATGVIDELPPFAGIERFYGRSVHHCPFCDGWEHQDQPLAVFGEGSDGVELAIKMRRWSDSVVLCSPDTGQLRIDEIALLELGGMRLKSGTIERLEGEGDALSAIAFVDGSKLECSALFFAPGQRQRSDLGLSLGCQIAEGGQLKCRETQETNVEGVFAIGNAARGLQLVIIAAAEGTRAAFAIDEALHQADLGQLRLRKEIRPAP